MVEDDQFFAVHDQDRRARTAQHALQLLQHDLQQRLQLQVRRDDVGRLQQHRQLARTLGDLLLQQPQ
jgi:hypothetical protein